MSDNLHKNPLQNVTLDPATVRGTDGFYRVGRCTKGRWWLVTPDGRPMIYKGCNGVLRQDVGQAGENLYFQWAEEQYGANLATFVDDATRILKETGFNGWGGWSMLFTPNAGHRDSGLPFVEIINSRELVGKDHMVGVNLDVFDPDCWRIIEEAFSARWTDLRDHRDLLGYFCDNECMYGQPETDAAWTGKFSDLQKPPSKPTLLQQHLVLPEDRPGGIAAWAWLLARHGNSMKKLTSAWGFSNTGPAALRAATEAGLILCSDGYAEDHAAFTRLYVREYYHRMHGMIRAHDPNHMIMTTRLPAPPGMLVLDELRACFADGLIDVLAMNNYRDAFFDRLNEYCADGALPILNGEFNWCSGHFLDWGRYLREERFTEQEMHEIARRGRAALENAFTHPSLIGYTWFKWYSGREFCKDAYGVATDQPFGAVVSNRGEINTFNRPLLQHIHARLDGIAAGTIQPVPVPDLGPVPQTVGI